MTLVTPTLRAPNDGFISRAVNDKLAPDEGVMYHVLESSQGMYPRTPVGLTIVTETV